VNHNTPTYTRHRVFILTEAQTYINPSVHCIPLFFASVSTPTLISRCKTLTVGTHRGAHEIKLHESNGVSINNQVSYRLRGRFWDLFSYS
jgi:hypothetical protein